MAVELVIAPEAQRDLEEAYAWYEDRRAGLGEALLSRVDACLQAILRRPNLHEIVHLSYRRALLRRFPYAVYYEVVDSKVIVFGLFHTSQDPRKWRRRLE